MERTMVADVGAKVPGMAEAVEKRAKELGLTPKSFAEHAKLTGPGLAPVRGGHRRGYEAKTLQGVARALRWPLDWYDRLVAGHDWRAFPDVDHPDVPLSVEQRISRLEAQVADLLAMVTSLVAAERQQDPTTPS